MTSVHFFLEQQVSNWSKQRYILAISGGVDSMVLLHQFAELFPNDSRQQLQVVHVNHQLREVAINEERLVCETCRELDISYKIYRWETGSHIVSNVEAEARKFRYQKFQEAMNDFNAGYVVLAHHGDDQVETMLMKAVRGSTLTGLAGMRSYKAFASGFLLRPFLTLEKKALEEFALQHQIAYLEDESNYSSQYTRNRYRHQIVPLLKVEQPQLVAHFQKNAQLLQDCSEVLQPIVQQQFEKLMTADTNHFSWDCSVFNHLPLAMQRLILQELSERMQGILSAQHLQLMQQAMISDRAQLELHFPQNWRFKKSYEQCLLIQCRNSNVVHGTQPMYVMDSNVDSIQLSSTETVMLQHGETEDFVFSVDKQDFPLVIRHRQTGDKLIINHKGQHQTVQRWCINQKIPQAEREKLWVVESNQQKIIAILGYRGSQSLSNTSETDKIRIFYRKNNEVQEC